jgi:hypothetical protein
MCIKISFEGGVAGQLFNYDTKFSYRPGWLILMRISIKLNYSFYEAQKKSAMSTYSGLSSEFSSIINHPGRERKYCIYMIINRPDVFTLAWLLPKIAHWAIS